MNSLELILFPYISLLDVTTLRIAKNASACTLNGVGLSAYKKLNKLTDTLCDLLWLARACQGTKTVSLLKMMGSGSSCHESERSVTCPQGLGSFHFLLLSKFSSKIPREK